MNAAEISRTRVCSRLILTALTAALGVSRQAAGDATWDQIREQSGVRGGLVVHVGCGRGELTATLGPADAYIVHGLDTDAKKVMAARELIKARGIYGKVSVDVLDGRTLPYVDNLVNLVVAEDFGDVRMEEILRVLAPGGVAYVEHDGEWHKQVKSWPDDIDEWTHYLHDATGNAVADDTVVGPPRRMQWVGSPRWGRHHDHMSSVSAVVTSDGRLFCVVDEAPRFSILIAPQWKLVARDAFNGTILWKRTIGQWYNHLHRLKSGPAELPRRLVAQGDRVYVTLGLDAPISVLDAATGETVRTYKNTAGADEILISDGIVLVLIGGDSAPSATAKPYGENLTDPSAESDGRLIALNAESGDVLWKGTHPVVKLAFAMNNDRVVLLSADRVLCLDKKSGEMLWRSEPVARAEKWPVRSGPTLVLYEDVVFLAGGEIAADGNRSWKIDQNDTLTALSIKDGTVLWKAPHPLSGYASPEDVLVVDGKVWIGETTSGHAVGRFVGRDVRTGEVVSEFDPDVDTYWFHHRCYRGKATDRFLLMSRTGTEFIDFEKEHWDINHWVRGACLYGVMPANGLLYAPQNPCACAPEAKQYGLNALAPAKTGPRVPPPAARKTRLQKGPAYSQIDNRQSTIVNRDDWPTYRHDNARSGRSKTQVPLKLASSWKANLGGNLSGPVVADGKVFVASKDTHTVHALDARSGEILWSYTTGARVDSPPTVWNGMVLFGSTDGYVYNVRAADGTLVWRFRAAPMDQRAMWFEQLESVWPVHGSALVQGGVVYCVAGRSAFLDDGMRLIRLDARTGQLISETVLNERDSDAGKMIQDYTRQHNIPVSLPDILSSDGRLVYMRSQPFDLAGKRLPLEALPYAGNPERYSIPATQRPEHAHLFCPTGFLDDSWWHRTYWIYGSRFLGGWAGYSQAGRVVPAGKILVFDEENVYGYGRQPQYYRWTTPIEHHLFSAAKNPAEVEQQPRKGAKKRQNQQRGFKVVHHWTRDIPFFARAMVMAGRTLFIAGPADIVDENEIRKRIGTPEAERQLREQVDAFVGKRGAMLWAVSAADGEKQAELKLDVLPVFDGMAAAYGKLYVSTVDGNVLCLGGER